MKNIFLTNYSQIKFLDKIKNSLSKCTKFFFSVSFIKKAGLVLLIEDIENALRRGAIGKIITTTYQNFTDIPSLKMFMDLTNKYNNFSCNLDYNNFPDVGYHSKGYIFEYGNTYEIIVGSSNITRFALLKNIEWNVATYGNISDLYYLEIIKEYLYLFSKTTSLTNEIIDKYTVQIEYAIQRWDMDFIDFSTKRIRPNSMQRKALVELSKYRARGVVKALIIAATGSGKTYLAAFDALNFNAKKVLFIVHRENILNEALRTFSIVFGASRTYGFYTGNYKEIETDFLFATNLSLYKDLALFHKKEFDYIVIDEVHHAEASTYKRIIEYFNPEFLLGLTATPERMDNPEAIFELFEKNVPYELRLRDALENNLIVPFKYYGIKDTLVDYSNNVELRNLVRQLSDQVHCEFIKENIEIHRNKISGKLKALAFCRTIEHAKLMAEEMTLIGYNCVSLTGSNNIIERSQAFIALQDESNPLEIIFTVDILNEGVDIPSVNMVIFLRPTESSTIFIQQLGRGLRLYDNKKYLIVLDFIGNSYTRSVQIALALGTLSNNIHIDKRMLASFVRKDFKQLELDVEINLDEQSKEEILRAIENTNFNSLSFLRKDYENFKIHLKKTTFITHLDYLNNDVSVDLLKYIKKYGSYYEFLLKVKDDLPIFTKEQRDFLKYISSFLPLVRPYEHLIISALLEKECSYLELYEKLSKIDKFSETDFNHALENLENLFYSDKQREKLTNYLSFTDNSYKLINVDLTNSYKEHLEDLLIYSLKKYDIDFYNVETVLNLYFPYDRASLLLALSNHTFASREGLIWQNNNLYIFIDLKKDQAKEEHLLYDDRFISNSILQWETSTNTTLNNSMGKRIIKQKYVEIFVRKIKKEDGIIMPYIYIGRGELKNPRVSNNIKKSLLFDITLENKIPSYLKYDFEIEEEDEENN